MKLYKVEITIPPFIEEIEAKNESKVEEEALTCFWQGLQLPEPTPEPNVEITQLCLLCREVEDADGRCDCTNQNQK